ncbi:MAG: hypothetical protein RSB51_06570, partial [Clostridia bacterium]
MKKIGMSLIVLVITILVMIILAGVVVVSLTKNNPIEKSKEALFKADIASFRDDLNLSVVNKLANTNTLVKEEIDASGKDMLKYAPSMTEEYISKLIIQDGKLLYIGKDKKEEAWFSEVFGGKSLEKPVIPEQKKEGKPVMKAGLTAIKWDEENKPVDIEETDIDWFDYRAKNWANVRTEDGSMWTWIPRYAYRIIYYDKPVVDNKVPAGGNILGYSDNRGLVDKDGKASTSFNRLNGRVEVVFLEANTFKYYNGNSFVGDVREKNTANNPKNFVVHPAFSAVRREEYTEKADGNFGWDAEIPGFFVSKFEMSEGCVSKQDTASQRSKTVSYMFDEGKKISTVRGITADSMLMTSTQWGAAAYLAKALGKEPAPSKNKDYITGNGDYVGSANQSTTGNVTGVYDMAGCARETMSAYVNNENINTAYGQNLITNKGTKYVDVYAMGNGNSRVSNYIANADKYGDALYEVSSNGANNPK